jgi:GNAT superfamily N-acetyltransferase
LLISDSNSLPLPRFRPPLRLIVIYVRDSPGGEDMTTTVGALPEGLVAHLTGWTGGWPPALPAMVTGNPRNAAPGWDGRIHPVTGVVDPVGRALIGVPPEYETAAQDAAAHAGSDLVGLLRALPAVLARPQHVVYTGIFRWTTTPSPLADAGDWIEVDDPVVPDWLHPFGGRVLVARDDQGRYLAGVGVKRYDRHGQELSVGTQLEARGRGLGRRLVAQAARALLEDGIVPTYLHDPANVASARVAEAAGFLDLGWRVLGMFDPSEFDDSAQDAQPAGQ